METHAISKDWVRIVQEYIIEEQLKGAGEGEGDERRNSNSEGLKKIIQQAFIKHQILSFDNIKALLENDDDIFELYETISKRSSSDKAKDVFYEAIGDLKDFIKVNYGLAPKRKKAHEILSEKLDEKFGDGHIDGNVNKLLEKNLGNGGTVCDDGGCGC